VLMNETKLSLTEAAKKIPSRPHSSTLWRWCRQGLHGVKLEYLRYGRRIYTTLEALDRFAQALAQADIPPSRVERQ
jgi:hypothetical protein